MTTRPKPIVDTYRKVSWGSIQGTLQKILIWTGILSVFWACSHRVYGEQKSVNRIIAWVHVSQEPDLAGFYIYAAPQSEDQRVYSRSRRYKISDPAAREAFILDMSPSASGGWCFQVTAFDSKGNESGFSKEVCGWFGMDPSVDVGTVP